MPTTVAAGIVRLGIATVTPLGGEIWRVSKVSKVGVVRVGDAEVRIEPKVPLGRLFFLLSRVSGWDKWRDEEVALDSIDQLYPALAELFARSSEKLLRAGILRSYRERRAAEAYIRGRWLISEQIRTRRGLLLPAELSYDDFTVDIDENRMLRSAAKRLLALPKLQSSLRGRLHRIESQLAGAHLLTPGTSIPRPTTDRRSAHYRTSLGLARLVLEEASLDQGVADVSAAGFLVNMATVFERFIESELERAARAHGGHVSAQRRDPLDRDALVEIRPDLVWLREGRVSAVFDAKYKAEKFSGYPNPDIYQMLAYCIRHGVSEGHLIYAAGNESPARIAIDQAGVTVVCHAIDLDASPDQIMRQLDLIVESACAEPIHR